MNVSGLAKRAASAAAAAASTQARSSAARRVRCSWGMAGWLARCTKSLCYDAEVSWRLAACM